MITPRGWPESYGGAEEQCFKQAELLREHGWRVVILTSRTQESTPAVSRRGDIPYIRIAAADHPDKGRWNVISALWWILRCIWFLRKRKFDLIHSHQGKIHALIGCFYNWKKQKPHFVKIGNAGVGFDLMRLSGRKPYGPLAVKTMLKYTTGFIAISRTIEAELESHGVEPSKMHYIPNCVSINENSMVLRNTQRDVLLKQEGVDPGQMVFCVVGRLEHQKLVDLTLDAFLSARQCMPDGKRMALCFVGDGVLQAELEAKTKKAQADQYVRFLGCRSNVPELMHAFDALLLISKSEGLSNALLESMSAGCIPVGSKVSGNVDLIDHGISGYLVDNEVEAVSQSILNLVAASSESIHQMSNHAYAAVKSCCDKPIIGQSLSRLFVKSIGD